MRRYSPSLSDDINHTLSAHANQPDTFQQISPRNRHFPSRNAAICRRRSDSQRSTNSSRTTHTSSTFFYVTGDRAHVIALPGEIAHIRRSTSSAASPMRCATLRVILPAAVLQPAASTPLPPPPVATVAVALLSKLLETNWASCSILTGGTVARDLGTDGCSPSRAQRRRGTRVGGHVVAVVPTSTSRRHASSGCHWVASQCAVRWAWLVPAPAARPPLFTVPFLLPPFFASLTEQQRLGFPRSLSRGRRSLSHPQTDAH